MGGAGIARSHMGSLSLQDEGGTAMSAAEKTSGAMGERKVAVGYLHCGVRLTAQLPHRLDHLGETAAVARVIVAQTTAVGIEREFADYPI